MNPRRLTYGIALGAIVAIATSYTGSAQESPVAHATRVLDLLEAGKFEDVAAEFNAKMAAAMPVSRLRDMWTTVSRRAGARTSIIRQRVVTQATGNVTYPTLNHLFMVGEGEATPAEYERPGKVAEFVLDDIADWIGKS
jgi:hypothetical protein